MTVEAVIFDWGGTLTPWNSVEPRESWLAFARAVHDDPAHADEVAAALLGAEQKRWATVLDDHRAFTTAQVLADAAITGDPAALDAYKEFWVQVSHVRPEAAPVLDELRGQGLRLGLLSSTHWPRDWHEEWLARDGLLERLDACVWSSDLPYTKPHRTAFLVAMEAVGVTDPSTCVYVGDRLFDDVHGAQAAGMRAVLVPHSDVPAHQVVAVDVTPDAVLDRLSDLPGIIATW
ncbi:HAD family hydrolase [Pseudonocardia sp. CA-107938]|uniref:HAD family hydrolase n=1 Tax=Pseudonocardia sp. CA-107938 TaxID=3240021 RepID=UPI003D939CC0